MKFIVFFSDNNRITILADHIDDDASWLTFWWRGEVVGSFNWSHVCGYAREDKLYDTN